MRVLSGFQPSGKFHLGNYFGSIRPNIEFQQKSEVSYFIVVDLHSLTTIRNPNDLREYTIDNVLDFLACGLDPNHSVLFRQSDIPEHAELTWILSTLCPMGLMERAVSFKEKVEKGIDASVGLFIYPILQTSDIILYHPEKIPVGKDQKQHIEMARDLAGKFNSTYGDTFTLPEAVVQEDVAIVPGIDGQKMSKSYGNTIPLFGDEKSTEKAIMSIVTDSKGPDEPKDPETNSIFMLHKLLLNEAEASALADEYREGIAYGDAKKKLFAAYMDYFGPMREARAKLTVKDAQEVLKEGKKRAQAVASKTMDSVRNAVGLR
jgi:tryptophanyl-tRNA synthetase